MNSWELYVCFQATHKLVSEGQFGEAKQNAFHILEVLTQEKVKAADTYRMISNVAGLFVDIGHLNRDRECATIGLKLMVDNQSELLKVMSEQDYYYNLGNAKGNMLSAELPYQRTFETIQELLEIKQCFWKASKAAELAGEVPPEFVTNLATNLRQQFRIVEALDWYERVVCSSDIAQAHINRAEALKMLNVVSNTYTFKLLDEVATGYERAISIGGFPPQFLPYYEKQAASARRIYFESAAKRGVDLADAIADRHANQMEYESLSEYRRFCLDKRLALSEHSLYCPCVASARDDLTIPTISGVQGEFVIEMESVLNRLKSEFSFARRLYYEYLHYQQDEDIQHESCFSELYNDELLGVHVEKLRTSFRFCFGILDKIAEAVCDLHDLHPQGNIYFHNFWQLSKPDRMLKFKKVSSPGLLALYSIATDLDANNSTAEWGVFKDWRNALEHRRLIIRPEYAVDVLGSYKKDNAVIVTEQQFIYHLELMLKLTRSAIFSFVFMVRDKACIREGQGDNPSFPIRKQDFQ